MNQNKRLLTYLEQGKKVNPLYWILTENLYFYGCRVAATLKNYIKFPLMKETATSGFNGFFIYE